MWAMSSSGARGDIVMLGRAALYPTSLSIHYLIGRTACPNTDPYPSMCAWPAVDLSHLELGAKLTFLSTIGLVLRE